jgi:hypothetical protein
VSLFRKPIARVYVEEMRRAFDSTTVPIFMPDTDVDVGYIGSFDGGRFVRRGQVEDLGVDLQLAPERQTGAFSWASTGDLSFGPSIEVPGPLGQPLVKSTIKLDAKRTVAISCPKGVERAVQNSDEFGLRLMKLWAERQLRTDRVVIWSVRRAPGGTVIVSTERGNEVEVVADAGTLAGFAGLSLGSLSVGVQFGAHGNATWTYSETATPTVLWARVMKLDERTREAVDAFGFEAADELRLRLRDERPEPFGPEDLLGALEGDQDE